MTDTRLQTANRLMIERYGHWVTHRLTLTMLEVKAGKTVARSGWNKGAVTEYEQEISNTAAEKSVRYFIECLNYKLWGRKTRKRKTENVCRIIAIAAIEGQNGNKRRHVHILLGNMPKNKLDELEGIIDAVWSKAKWGMKRKKLEDVYDCDGAAFYSAKEVGFVNNDAVNWEISSIPRRLISD